MLFALSEMSCRPETVDGFLAIVRLEFAMRRAQDGHLGARVGRDLVDPSRIIVLEQWTGTAAFHRYLANPRAASFAAAIPPAVISGQLHLLSAQHIVDSAQTAACPPAADEPDRPCLFLYEGTIRDPAAYVEGIAALQACARTRPGFLFAYDAADVSAPDEVFGAVGWKKPVAMRAAFGHPTVVACQQQVAALASAMPRFRAIYSSTLEVQAYPVIAEPCEPQPAAAAA